MTTNVPPDRPFLRWSGVCLDCADADELAQFYGRLLGWEITARDGNDWIAMRDPAGGVGLNFQAEAWYQPPVWPEQPGAQTKMLHFEIQVADMEPAVAHAIAAGARMAPHQPADRAQDELRVLLDPAGPRSACTLTSATQQRPVVQPELMGNWR